VVRISLATRGASRTATAVETVGGNGEAKPKSSEWLQPDFMKQVSLGACFWRWHSAPTASFRPVVSDPGECLEAQQKFAQHGCSHALARASNANGVASIASTTRMAFMRLIVWDASMSIYGTQFIARLD